MVGEVQVNLNNLGGESEPINSKPQIEVAGKNVSTESLRARSAGEDPSVGGEILTAPAGISNQQLEQTAQETAVPTQAEQQQAAENIQAIYADLPEVVKNAKTPEDADEAIRAAEAAHQQQQNPELSEDEIKAQVEKKMSGFKRMASMLGAAGGQFLYDSLAGSDAGAFLEWMASMFGEGVGSSGFSRSWEGGQDSIISEYGNKSRAEFVDQLKKGGAKKFGENLWQAYGVKGGLREQGWILEDIDWTKVQQGDISQIHEVMKKFGDKIEGGGLAEKARNSMILRSVLAQSIFNDQEAFFREDVVGEIKKMAGQESEDFAKNFGEVVTTAQQPDLPDESQSADDE